MVLLVCLGPSLDLWGSMSRFPNGRRRARMCASGIWKQSLEGGQRDGGQEGFIGIFLGGFKNCAAGLSAALVFLILLPALPAKDEKALANRENSVV